MFSLRVIWAQWVQALCQSTLVLNKKMELSPELKPYNVLAWQIVQSNANEIISQAFFFLVDKRENSCSDEQPHTLSILGDANTWLHHTGWVTATLAVITVLLILLVNALKLNLHEAICMQWWNWFFHSGYSVVMLEAPMSLQVRHPDSSAHAAAVLGPGYLSTCSMFVPFLPSITISLINATGFYCNYLDALRTTKCRY